MTTKPKAKKFRIRRNTPTIGAGGAPETPVSQAPRGSERPHHQPATVRPTASSAPQAQPQAPSAPAVASEMTPDQEIDAIKREGLTGRQLRMARRIAQKNDLAPTSDYDAVRLLRANGIDPFQRTNMLELVSIDQHQPQTQPTQNKKIQLPQTMAARGKNLPSTEFSEQSPAERRAIEIGEIQRDIARRRRRRLALLMARLSVFVFLPTILAGWYFYSVATPMYSSKSAFVILQADGASAGGALGSLLPSQFATNQDSIATQDYLTSKDAMLRLDSDVGFKEHFSDPQIDPIQRLAENPSNEQAYKLYKKYVKIGYDPTEGTIRMEVSAADPLVAAEFSKRLISYAEQRVDELSQRKREDQLADALKGLAKAREERRTAQEALVKLQSDSDLLDPEGLISSLRSQVSNVQIQLQEKELQLQALLDNARPNQARVDGVTGDIRRLRNLLTALEAKMTEAAAGESSLAQKTAQIKLAQADLATADLLMQTALQTLKQTELEANRQVRYLTTSVEPVASQDPSYPRSFENTAVAFLIFSGIYLMISLTASILREQVSS